MGVLGLAGAVCRVLRYWTAPKREPFGVLEREQGLRLRIPETEVDVVGFEGGREIAG